MNRRVLVVVAHADDEVLGCGGTIARHIMEGDQVNVMIMCGKSRLPKLRADEQREAANKAHTILGSGLIFQDFYDQELDQTLLTTITQSIERYVEGEDGTKVHYRPHIVYTHHAGDLNKDHRIVHEAVLTAFRPVPSCCTTEIYGFEVRSSTDWALVPFVPNHYVSLDAEDMEKKSQALISYQKEMRPFPHSRSWCCIEALSKLRGGEVGVARAEAFTTIRTIR